MPEIEPRVDEDKLRLLLREGHESAQLDYKTRVDLSERAEVVGIAKDIGAMCVLGGYIVIGADDSGQPTGDVAEQDVQAFDQARLQGKIGRYLPAGIEVRTAAHEIDGCRLVVVYIAPHPDGFVVFSANGIYKDGRNRDTFEFRAGEVFARHGSASERWTQDDIVRIRQGLRDRERETWRREFREDFADVLAAADAAQTAASAPAAALNWRLDEETLIGAIVEQLRRGDLIPLDLLITRMPSEARAAVDAGDRDTLNVLLDRLAAIAATLVLVRRQELLDTAISALVAIYNTGYDDRGLPRTDLALPTAVLWLDIIERVFAVGALAVRRRNWPAVRKLAMQVSAGYDFRDGFYKSWLRHALTEAARANMLGVEPNQRGRSVSLLNLALQHVDRLPALRPDLPAGDEALLSSLCQFDMLACLAVIAIGGGDHAYYPNFGQFRAERSDPAVVTLLSDDAARAETFPRRDEDLAAALREIAALARRQSFAFSGWRNFDDPRIGAFLAQHPDPAQSA